MRMSERMRAIKQWTYENLCKGRMMKAPSPDLDVTKILRQEPQVYLGWLPTRPDQTGMAEPDPYSVAPGILIMPTVANGKYVEEKRFNRFNKVQRSQSMGQIVSISMLFSVYEPGIRLPGFNQSATDGGIGLNPALIREATEEGLMTLLNWMDDAMELMIANEIIPGTDLFLNAEDLTYSLYSDENYITDKRPLFYGFVNAKYYGYADDRNNDQVQKFLE